MIISNSLKAKFCRDCKLLINLFDEPYFLDRLQLYDKQFNTMEKWQVFLDGLSKFNTEQDYFEAYSKVKDSAILSIRHSKGFKSFNKEDMTQYVIKHRGISSKDIYKPTNDRKVFISIDIKKANFNCLRLYSEDIFDYAYTWEDFIGKYTDNEHIIQSKYIRQAIMGACEPRNHTLYEHHITDGIVGKLLTGIVSLEDIVYFSHDEVVILVGEGEKSIEKANDMLFHISTDLFGWEVPLRIESFMLHKLKGVDGYYKDNFHGNIQFKGVTSFMMPFVLRKLYNQEVTESDKTFIYEGLRSQLIDVPKVEF